MWYDDYGGIMLISITDEGRLCLADYRSIHKAILTVLYEKPMRMIDLVFSIQRTYHEFKYLKATIIANTISDLHKAKLVMIQEIEDV